MRKTWKREAAGGGIAGVFVTAAAAIGLESESALRVLEIITAPVFGFAGLMFGADFVKKQTTWGGHPDDVDPFDHSSAG